MVRHIFSLNYTLILFDIKSVVLINIIRKLEKKIFETTDLLYYRKVFYSIKSTDILSDSVLYLSQIIKYFMFLVLFVFYESSKN